MSRIEFTAKTGRAYSGFANDNEPDALPVGWPWHVDGDNADPETRAAQLEHYSAGTAEYHARLERARKAMLAFNKLRDRNQPKAPKAVKPTYNKAYYEGGYRMVIDGVPIRMAAHVKGWKAKNRAALCQGFDPCGLTLAPHDKRGNLTSDHAPRFGWRFVEPKDCGSWGDDEPTPAQRARLNDAGYSIVFNGEENRLARQGCHQSAPEGDYSKWAQDRARGIRRLAYGVDLFMAARVATRA